MIWIDITDPKYALFFGSIIPRLAKVGELLVTSRRSDDYKECYDLLELLGIKFINVGEYGGGCKLEKLRSRVRRQLSFIDLFKKIGTPKLLITGASVESVQTAFGIGIPVALFADTPLKSSKCDDKSLTVLSRLCYPLASKIFYPFVLPKEAFAISHTNGLIEYGFIDVVLWLEDLKNGNDFRETYGIDKTRKTILIREEEFKAHYIESKSEVIYESIALLNEKIDANLVIMPRYGRDHLEGFGNLKNVFILDKVLAPKDFYPYIDILIGGGGTMNLEAAFLGIPVISVRSIFLYHDNYLIRNKLMVHAVDAESVLELSNDILCRNESKTLDHNRDLFIVGGNTKPHVDNIIEELASML